MGRWGRADGDGCPYRDPVFVLFCFIPLSLERREWDINLVGVERFNKVEPITNSGRALDVKQDVRISTY